AIAAIASGAPLRIIAQVKKPCTSVLLVHRDSPIKKYGDLKDKTIGGISPTCEAIIAITKAAKTEGGRFNLVKLPGGPGIAALEAGKVDGIILEEPHASIAELNGFKVMFRESSANIPCRTINARMKFLKENKDALRRMIKAVDEANQIILADPKADEIVNIAHKYTKAPKDAIRHGNHRLKFTIYLDTEGLVLLGKELVKMGNIKCVEKKMFADEFRGITWGRIKKK
ncbi:ABC transporter substrate-binding protein, partial [bacterium]|nr:ABC transporter substrate-binding protein [bacterium]